VEGLTQVQLLGALPPLKFGRAKNVQKLVRFTTTFERLSVNISGTDEDSDNM